MISGAPPLRGGTGLNGASSELKERTNAIDVFGRDPSYDPGADPVVRISAGKVRKRLAQYYQEMADPDPLRIELPVGSHQSSGSGAGEQAGGQCPNR